MECKVGSVKSGVQSGVCQVWSVECKVRCGSLCEQSSLCEKHRGLSAEKLLQYKFLYSENSKCGACMSYYARQPGLDKTCTSCGRNARQWAACSVGDCKLKKVPSPDDVEEWLRAHNL